jgi:hypothetical protein
MTTSIPIRFEAGTVLVYRREKDGSITITDAYRQSPKQLGIGQHYAKLPRSMTLAEVGEFLHGRTA